MTWGILELVLLSLATWRICHMLAREDGPLDIFRALRTWAGAHRSINFGWQAEGFLGKLIICPLCSSVWISTFLVAAIVAAPVLWPIVWILAVSALASIVHLALER